MQRLRSALLVSTVLAVGLVFVTASPASARTLGGINFDAYCNHTYSVPSEGLVGDDLLIGRNVKSWRCVTNAWWGEPFGWVTIAVNEINPNAACRWQYRRSDAKAAYRNYSDPYSWYCYV